MALDREKEFRTFLAEKFPSVKRGTSGVFHKEFGDKIKAAIKDPSSVDKNMRFFVKKKGFQILNIPSLELAMFMSFQYKRADAMNIQVHDTTGASPYQKARTVIFPTQQNAIVLEEDLADEGIDVGISSEQATVISTSQYQAFRSEEDANTDVEQDAQCSMSSSHQGSTTQNVVNEAEDTLHAEVSAAECETIEREVLEKNDDKLNGNELKCNGKRKCLREDALSTSLKHKKIRIKTDRKYLSSAKKMAERYNKQHSTLSFVIVSVRIPCIDRASSDLSRLPCVVSLEADAIMHVISNKCTWL
ncbi:hypothetical protein EMCRGX_G027000 [Ephydatia muelleri]